MLCPLTALRLQEARGDRLNLCTFHSDLFRVVRELDAPVQSDFDTWTLNAPIVKTCVGDARTNGCPVIALSASNTSFSESQKYFLLDGANGVGE